MFVLCLPQKILENLFLSLSLSTRYALPGMKLDTAQLPVSTGRAKNARRWAKRAAMIPHAALLTRDRATLPRKRAAKTKMRCVVKRVDRPAKTVAALENFTRWT